MEDEDFEKRPVKKSVFKDRSSIDHVFIPEILIGRDEAIKTLLMNFRRVIEEVSPPSINILVSGKGGIGKTVTVRYFAKEFKKLAMKYNKNILIEYFNCITFRSKDKIIRELLAKYTHGSGRGFSDIEALKLILKNLIDEKAYMLLVIDEVFLLKPEEILTLLNIAETFGHQNTRLSIILISRLVDWRQIENQDILHRVDDKIILDSYSYEDIRAILKAKRDALFKEGVINDDLLDMLTQIVLNNANIRHGIEIFRKSGLGADKEGKDRISANMIRNASNEVYPTFRADIIDSLENHDLCALYGITQSLIDPEIVFTTIEKAYEEYILICTNYSFDPHMKVTFGSYVENLAKLNIICKKSGKPTHLTLLNIPAQILKEILLEHFERKFN